MRVWLNDRIMDEAEARISPFDRGFIFGDGVYEGIRFFGRVGVGMDRHVERMQRSLNAAKIGGFEAGKIADISDALLADSQLDDAMVYLQVTRGVQIPRHHRPTGDLAPTVFAYAAPAPSLDDLTEPHVRSCKTMPDIRWSHCEIKCTSLLANVLGIIDASEAGYDEPIFERRGLIGEGAMTNVFISRDGVLLTPPTNDDPPILHGVTREIVLDVAPDLVNHVEVRHVSVDELHHADEVMIASSRRILDAVGRVDETVIGNGNAGPIAAVLLAKLRSHLAEACGVTLHSP